MALFYFVCVFVCCNSSLTSWFYCKEPDNILQALPFLITITLHICTFWRFICNFFPVAFALSLCIWHISVWFPLTRGGSYYDHNNYQILWDLLSFFITWMWTFNVFYAFFSASKKLCLCSKIIAFSSRWQKEGVRPPISWNNAHFLCKCFCWW